MIPYLLCHFEQIRKMTLKTMCFYILNIKKVSFNSTRLCQSIHFILSLPIDACNTLRNACKGIETYITSWLFSKYGKAIHPKHVKMFEHVVHVYTL